MNFIETMLLGFGLALVLTLIGFIRTVWFISLGYTLVIAVFSVLITACFFPILNIINYLQIGLLFLWAIRLGFFLLQRERNVHYNQEIDEQVSKAQALSLGVKIGIWTSVSVLYVAMFSPAIFAVGGAILASNLQWIVAGIGIAVSYSGLMIESLADSQKSKFKQTQPKAFTNIGLYQWVRCPNYLGEVLVWLGNFIAGAAFFIFWWQWLIALIGLVCIVLIMMGSTKRLEATQRVRYQNDQAYIDYCNKVPILFPWVPLYSLQKIKVYLE